MNWEPVYAVLIFSSTVITYVCAYGIDASNSVLKKRAYLIFSLVLNFGILFVFKYYDFVTESIFQLLGGIGMRVDFPEFKFLLPVGISFYTFQAVGYTIDVYYRKIQHETHFGRYALFVSFFPQLVAGPIERASSLLPQFSRVVKFNYNKAIAGTKLIIWGYFMKVVVADRLSIYVDSVYSNLEMHGSSTVVLATVFFAFQIYCDFAGYSNIAIGCAKILGFDLMTNFARPYFSISPVEFWHRWHISLSTWFKDYVYIPLGGSRVGQSKRYFNLLVTFLVSGLWHGANWTFVIWGGINGLYQIVYNFLGIDKSKFHSRYAKLAGISLTFILTCFAWIFFRASSLTDALMAIEIIFSVPGKLFIGDNGNFVYGLIGILVLISKDFYDEAGFHLRFVRKTSVQYLWYTSLVMLILLIGVFDGGQFIYFQF